MNFNEKSLIKGCIKGQKKYQQALYDRYCASMYTVAIRYTKVAQEAEDVLQEAFIKVFKYIKMIREDASLAFWIKKIVINTALNHQRNKLYLYPMVNIEDIEEADTDSILSGIAYGDILEMIKKLPPGCQAIFNLFAIEGYKHCEIAEMLHINISTSKTQYARAKRILSNKLNDLSMIHYEKRKI